MPRIRLLPDTLINQIAAGEVVERPASVVKELVENALDAGASAVEVEVERGGRELVGVADNGCGMEADDALLALERHATSKLTSAGDLEAIATLGFRGEALPSIAAVSRLVLETAAADGEGTRVEVEHGLLRGTLPHARPRGTRVSVRELFARLPARRKFLRSEGTELRHAVTIVTGLAYAHPGVAFTLRHNGRRLLELPAVREPHLRLADLLGAQRSRAAHPFRLASPRLVVEGALLPPSAGHELHILVNGRLVRDRLLAATVNRALKGPSGAAEADLFLHIRLDPREVDVNVHPTKAEVRFAEPGAVLAALTQALATARAAWHGPQEVRRVVTVPWRGPDPAGHLAPPAVQYRLPGLEARVAEALPEPFAGVAPEAPRSRWGRLVGQYRETYLVVEDESGLLLVDQHAAHERVLYEQLLAASGRAATQRLLLPEVVELPPRLAATAEEAAPVLEELGLEIEVSSGGSVRVLGVPASCRAARAGPLLQELLADLAALASPGEGLRQRAAASLACHAAIKKNRVLSRHEAEHLFAELEALEDPHRCPHGRPTMLRLSHAEIERRIGRT